MELGRENLDVVPARELRAGHAHGVYAAVMAHALEPVFGHFANPRIVGLVRCSVGVGVRARGGAAIKGLGVTTLPLAYLVFVHEDAVVLDSVAEFLQDLVVRIGGNPGSEAEVPPVHATDQVLAADLAVR